MAPPLVFETTIGVAPDTFCYSSRPVTRLRYVFRAAAWRRDDHLDLTSICRRPKSLSDRLGVPAVFSSPQFSVAAVRAPCTAQQSRLEQPLEFAIDDDEVGSDAIPGAIQVKGSRGGGDFAVTRHGGGAPFFVAAGRENI